jgi:hypothetical protein
MNRMLLTEEQILVSNASQWALTGQKFNVTDLAGQLAGAATGTLLEGSVMAQKNKEYERAQQTSKAHQATEQASQGKSIVSEQVKIQSRRGYGFFDPGPDIASPKMPSLKGNDFMQAYYAHPKVDNRVVSQRLNDSHSQAPMVSNQSKVQQSSNIWQMRRELDVLQGIASGLKDTTVNTVKGIGQAIIHPIDNVMMPAGTFIADVGQLAFFPYDKSAIQAANRMDARYDGMTAEVKHLYHDITSDDLFTRGHALGEFTAFGLTMFAGGAATKLSGLSKSIEGAKFATGGRQLQTVSEWAKAEQEARLFYEKIRSTNINYDSLAISRNTGIPLYRIERVKQHLFINTHQLSKGLGQFTPDIEIVDAWNRLEYGNFVTEDLHLLHHEYFESRYESIFKTDYYTAHSAALRAGYTWNPEEIITSPNIIRRP